MLNVNYFIEKMQKWPFCLFVNLALTIGIFLCALLGRSLGIQGPALAISVVWPATGLSLAALLLFGYYASVGVFAGNFAYNLFFLTVYPLSIHSGYPLSIHSGILAFIITLGSLAQALLSTYIIRTYSTPLIFRTVQDIYIFLIPAGLLACLISSTVGVTALAFLGGLDKSLILPVWLTFWLGDTVGIYVITPLIVVWTFRSEEIKFSDHLFSLASMIFLFLALSSITYLFDYPLPHLFVPISVWASYLFRMHGASVAIFLMTAASVTFAASHGYEGTSLISLITFIAVTIGASLIIASVVNERAQAWDLLDSRNVYLEKEVDANIEILEQVRSDISQKRKFATQGSMSKFLILQIHSLLSDIEIVTKSSKETTEEIQKLLTEQKSLTATEKKRFSEKLQQIRQGFSDMTEAEKLMKEVLESSKTSQ